MKTIKWGIIGCGDVCEIKSGPAFYKCEHSQLSAVMRRDAEKAEDFARRHHVEKWYTKAEDLINDPEVDIVYVATPPSTHTQYAIEVLKAGKPVYVEKPMAIDYNECIKMNEASKKYNQKLWVAYYRRSLPYFLKVKELLDLGLIGKIQTVSVQFSRPPEKHDLNPEQNGWRTDQQIAGGGYFYDMAPHTIDILYFLLGKIVDAKGFHGNTGDFYLVEDTINASFLFESGVIVSGLWCYASSESDKKDIVEISGMKGRIRFATFSFSPIVLTTNSGTEHFDIPSPQHIQQPMIQSIVNEMLGLEKSPSNGESGAHTSWVIDKIFDKII